MKSLLFIRWIIGIGMLLAGIFSLLIVISPLVGKPLFDTWEIVYAEQHRAVTRWTVYASDVDRDLRLPLIQDIPSEAAPIISPNRQYAVANDDRNLLIYNRYGELKETIPDAYLAAWSPDSDKLAYFTQNILYTLTVDTNQEPVEITSVSGLSGAAVWSPDSQAIAYLSDGGLYVLSPGSRSPLKLSADYVVPETYRAWSPDGRMLAFSAWNSSYSKLDVLISDQTQVYALSAPNISDDTRPVWSPDGSAVVFLSDPDRTNQTDLEIVVAYLNPETGVSFKTFRPEPETSYISDIVWSPDSERLAYIANRDKAIYIVDTENETYAQYSHVYTLLANNARRMLVGN